MKKPAAFPITVTVPRMFYKDHLNRDCGQTGKVIKETKTTMTVSLDEEAWIDLYGDADYYISFIRSEDYSSNAAIVESAVRTMARLEAAVA